MRPGSRVFLHQAFRCCPFAGAVSSQIHEFLVRNGYEVTSKADEAEVHLVNTCGSDASQAELTWHALQTIAQKAPGSEVVVTGCLVSIDPKRLAGELRPFASTARLDPRHMAGLDQIFGAPHIAYADVQPTLRHEYQGNDFASRWHHIVASTGCFGTCQFCAIRRATGRPKSRTIDSILEDVRRGLAEGTHDILLVSTDLSAYGTDLGTDIVDLVAAVTTEPGDVVYAGESFEPTLFLRHFDALLPWFASGRWAYVGLPIQSGSRRVLAEMERTYDPAEVVDAVRRLKAAAPGLVVRTDLLYGFGDETDEEFQASVEVSRVFDLPSFNAYQPRPGTPELRLSSEVVRRRRDVAFAEMQARAQAGLPPIKRWGGRDDRSQMEQQRAGRGEGAVQPERALDPWETPDGRAWLVATARRFAGVLQRHKSVPLAEGWVLSAVRVAEDAVALGLRHAGGRTVEVGLRAPEWPGEVMAKGARFGVWVLGGEVTVDASLDAALKRLVVGLGAGGDPLRAGGVP